MRRLKLIWDRTEKHSSNMFVFRLFEFFVLSCIYLNQHKKSKCDRSRDYSKVATEFLRGTILFQAFTIFNNEADTISKQEGNKRLNL